MEPTTTPVSLESLMAKLNEIERKVDHIYYVTVNCSVPPRWPYK